MERLDALRSFRIRFADLLRAESIIGDSKWMPAPVAAGLLQVIAHGPGTDRILGPAPISRRGNSDSGLAPSLTTIKSRL